MAVFTYGSYMIVYTGCVAEEARCRQSFDHIVDIQLQNLSFVPRNKVNKTIDMTKKLF